MHFIIEIPCQCNFCVSKSHAALGSMFNLVSSIIRFIFSRILKISLSDFFYKETNEPFLIVVRTEDDTVRVNNNIKH